MKVQRAVGFLAFALLLLVIPAVLSTPSSAQIGIGISVRIGPPALPVYDQPICPGEGYMWTPGYWAWDDDDGYYWVPGTWVEAPDPGLLWTPGYWGWNDGLYVWNGGYWGEHVGFYGGINYGFGYGGEGFGGGEWRGGSFFYNTAVMHVNTVNITNVYVNRTVIVNNESHVAFNGGQGGVQRRPTAQEETYSHEQHRPPVAAQTEHVQAASKNRALFASTNHGRPAVAATAKPGDFKAHVVPAKAAGAPYHAPAMSPKAARAAGPSGSHAAEKPAGNRPAAAGGAKAANHSSASHPPTNHPSANRAPANRPSAAASKKPAASNRPASEASGKPARPAENHSTETHAAKPAPKPATPHAAAPAHEARPASEPKAASTPHPAPKAAAPKPTHEAAPRESAPKPTHAAAPRESAPKPTHEAAPKPAPRESTPKPSAPRAAAPRPAPAPKPAKPAAPPKQAEPKEHKPQ